MLEDSRPERKSRDTSHCPPHWVPESSTFFITINCQQRGRKQLTHDAVASGLLETMAFYHLQRRWHIDLALLMPDHLHALLSFSWDPGKGMMNMIRNWKRYTASHLGIVWQRDYFDHRIRSEADLQSTWFYIRENPVRAGLVDSFEHWPHVWRPEIGIGW